MVEHCRLCAEYRVKCCWWATVRVSLLLIIKSKRANEEQNHTLCCLREVKKGGHSNNNNNNDNDDDDDNSTSITSIQPTKPVSSTGRSQCCFSWSFSILYFSIIIIILFVIHNLIHFYSILSRSLRIRKRSSARTRSRPFISAQYCHILLLFFISLVLAVCPRLRWIMP